MEPLGWTNGTGVCVSSFQIGAITISFTLEIPGEVRIMGGFLFLGGPQGPHFLQAQFQDFWLYHDKKLINDGHTMSKTSKQPSCGLTLAP